MDFDSLREIDLLFRTRWLTFAIAALAERPLGYRDLLRAVRAHADTDINESTLTRLLRLLLDAGLATRTRDWRMRHVYTLTDEGQNTLAKIDTLTQALHNLNLRNHRATDDPGTPPAA